MRAIAGMARSYKDVAEQGVTHVHNYCVQIPHPAHPRGVANLTPKSVIAMEN